jgi:hypothetical protein
MSLVVQHSREVAAELDNWLHPLIVMLHCGGSK